jgi:enamine deaminase RidA (YjgF/YER057c/UK114 family)
MLKRFNPDGVVKPASRYAQAVIHPAAAERIVISGQLGVKPDGTLEQGLEAQMRRAWSNIITTVLEAGFTKEHLVKATVFVAQRGQVALYRRVRDEVMDGVIFANTYIEVAGLASPDFLVEIEAEAVKA